MVGKNKKLKLNNSKIRPKGWSEKYTGLSSVILQAAVNYQMKTEKVVRYLSVIFTCY